MIKKLFQAIILKKRSPLIVSWNITYRCNLQCKYCAYWQRKSEELGTQDIFRLVEELTNAGTKFISFNGGEPLLREDLADIIDFCRNKNIHTMINSNGTLVKKGIAKIKKVNEIQFSLDGPRQINDAARGRGVYDKVIEAIEICKSENIKVNLNTVISKYNIAHIPHILDLAKKYKINIYFHPADQNHSGNSDKNIFGLPDENEFKKVISYLIKEKSKGYKFINNSLTGLRHLYHWPEPQKIFCLVNLLCCSIEPDGKIFICDNFPYYQRFLISANSNFKGAFDSLSLPHPCRQCWCGAKVEFNLMGSFRADSMIGIWKRYSSSL